MSKIEYNYGDKNQQIFQKFREVAKSYASLFEAQRDHVFHLLGNSQQYSSGIFREGILRSFFTTILPKSVSVSSGFIYGFEQTSNSKQLDILIWDSTHYAAVYETKEFVIIPPEAAIAAITVKSKLGKTEIKDALQNLLSITNLDLMYRRPRENESEENVLPPIRKLVVTFSGPTKVSQSLKTIGSFYEQVFAENVKLSSFAQECLSNLDPFNPSASVVNDIRRIFPIMIASIGADPISFTQGWGPPEDIRGEYVYGPGLRRLPYFYRQRNSITTPLEKIVYHLLTAVYLALGTKGWSLVAAWGELNPIVGVRSGDASEIDEENGIRLLNPDHLAHQISSTDASAKL